MTTPSLPLVAAALIGGFLPLAAWGQGTPLYQQGVTAPGSPAVLIENGKISDGLVVGQKGSRVYGAGTPSCVYDVWPSPAHSICFGAGVGTATIKVDGVSFPFPGAGATLPTSFAAPIHQNYGGNATGHIVPFLDGNIDVMADHIGVQTTDASLAVSATVSGVPTPGDVPGINLTLNGIGYTIRYTAQGGDTATSVAAALANCIGSTLSGGLWIANVQAHCIVSPSTFTADLLALGYITRPNSTGAGIGLDMPWGLTTAFAGVTSGTTIVTIASFPDGFNLDNGPYIYAQRQVLGRAPTTNDQIGWYRGDGASSASSGVDTQYGGLKIRVGAVGAGAADPSHPYGTVSLEGANGVLNSGSVPLLSCESDRGCWVEDGIGANPNRANSANSVGGFAVRGKLLQSTSATGAIGTFTSSDASHTGYFVIGGDNDQVQIGEISGAPFLSTQSAGPLQLTKGGGGFGTLQLASLVLGTTTTALQLDGSGHLLVSSASTKNVVMSPGGGAVTLKVTPTDAIFGQGSPLATGATAGFLYVNSMAGAPTGAPAAWATGVVPVAIDTTNHKICWNETGAGGGWKCALGS